MHKQFAYPLQALPHADCKGLLPVCATAYTFGKMLHSRLRQLQLAAHVLPGLPLIWRGLRGLAA